MYKELFDVFARPVVPDRERLSVLLELQSAAWPNGLNRYTAFKRARDPDSVRYRAVCWNPYKESLVALKVNPLVTPDGPGQWVTLSANDDDRPFDDMQVIPDVLTPPLLKGTLEQLPASCRSGLAKREMMLNAVLFVDPVGDGNPEYLVFNDTYFLSEQERISALNRVCADMNRSRGFQSYLRELVHKHVRFGGVPNALANLSFLRGGPGVPRVGTNVAKPGRKSGEELRADARAIATGGQGKLTRRYPARPCDIKKFVAALMRNWVGEHTSKEYAYADMVERDYKKWPRKLIPTIFMFRHHANDLIEKHDMKRLRNGRRLSAQNIDARPGQASALTHGTIDVVDVDGFIAKIGIAVRIGNKVESVHITVMFAVSRLSGAILGYELAITGEDGEAFRRCIASVFLPKEKRARELGLESTKGLLHGNIDAIFVDNGAGASETVIATACEQMGLMRSVPPGGRGDYKGVGEGVNSLMVLFFSRERSGYTRGKSLLEREVRRRKQKQKPVTLIDFERLLLKAIMHYNRYTNKARLRTRAMVDAGIGITPTAIFNYTQAQRRGDGARLMQPFDVYERFIPWQPKACSSGVVKFMRRRYTSDELVAHFNECAKAPGKVSCYVDVKRLDGPANTILWRHADGAISELQLTDEDERNVGSATWKELDLMNIDEGAKEDILKPKRGRSVNQLTVKQDGNIADAESNRIDGYGGLEGDSPAAAKRNAKLARDEMLGAEQAGAYRVEREDTPEPALSDAPRVTSEVEEEYFRSLGL